MPFDRKTIEKEATAEGVKNLRAKEAELKDAYGEIAGIHTDMRNSHETLAETTRDYAAISDVHDLLVDAHESLENYFLSRYEDKRKGVELKVQYSISGNNIYGNVPPVLPNQMLALAESMYKSSDGSSVDWRKLSECHVDLARQAVVSHAGTCYVSNTYFDVAALYEELAVEYYREGTDGEPRRLRTVVNAKS